jgi:hypothetical protein
MKTLFFILLLSVTGFAQTNVDPLLVEKRTGEPITLTINNSDLADSFNIYRKTSTTSTPMLVGAIAAQPNVYIYTWSTGMPGGTTPQYRFWVVVKRNGVLEGESNVARVKRIK